MSPTKPPFQPKVHIIDDEPALRESISTLLATAGVEPVLHDSAEAFLASGAHKAAVCAILDNRMTGMSGLDLLQRLKDLRSEATIIMLTGHADVPTAVAAMKLGAFHFIEKPFDGEALLSAVDEALSRADKIGDEIAETNAFAQRYQSLTQRESEVFSLLMEGLPTKAIAARLEITGRTAEHHRAAVMRKLEARSISHLMRIALNLNRSLTDPKEPAR
jgi:two-component system response regulator FixJ